MELTPELIDEAEAFLEGRIRKTPVEYSPALSEHLGADTYLKLECLQVTGSFKVRGALFAMHRLQRDGVRHVATCSAGNHGKGVAWAARELDMEATIYVPGSVDSSKLKAMRRMGADVEVSEWIGYDDTEEWALAQARRRSLPFISAYDDEAVMAANGGTVSREVLRQVPGARTFVMPVGGGGHAAGFTVDAELRLSDPRFVMCQHEDSPGFLRSVEAGEPVTELPGIETLASGLEGGLGRRTFPILKNRYDEIRLVSESELRAAMRWMIAEHDIIVEGSSAVAVAACLKEPSLQAQGDVVVFISGRNVAIETVRRVLC